MTFTTFPRTVLPAQATWPKLPTGLASFGNSGRGQVRTTQQIGRRWTEFWPPLKASDPNVRAFLAQLNECYRQLAAFDVDHRSQRTMLGVGGGTPLVAGASQTGSNLATRGWTPSTGTVVAAGDLIRIPGLNQVLEVTGAASSDGSGLATVPISAPLFTGGSPDDNAALIVNSPAGSVLFRAMIEDLQMPEAGADEFYAGLQVAFREMPALQPNLLTAISDFGNAAWVTGGAQPPTVTVNQLAAPDGTTTADKLSYPATSGVQQGTIVQYATGQAAAGKTWTAAAWLRRAGGAGNKNIKFAIARNGTGAIQPITIVTVTESWQRFAVTATADATAGDAGLMIYQDVSQTQTDIYAWGARLMRELY